MEKSVGSGKQMGETTTTTSEPKRDFDEMFETNIDSILFRTCMLTFNSITSDI